MLDCTLYNTTCLFNETVGCLDLNKTHTINLHAHVQNEVRDAIVSLAPKFGSTIADEIQGAAGEKASVTATHSHFGAIIERLIADPENFKLQNNLVFEKLEIDEINANGAFDPTCELAAPVLERNQNTFSTLTSKLNVTVGFHFYIYGCISRNRKLNLIM